MPRFIDTQPYVCPRCKAKWVSGIQHCPDCQVQVHGEWLYPEQALDSLMPTPAPTADVPSAVPPQGEPLVEEEPHPGDRRELIIQELSQNLERSLSAESALQAELVPLRERLAQVEQEKAQVLPLVLRKVHETITGPLQSMLMGYGVQAEVQAVIPAMAQLLKSMSAEVTGLKREVNRLQGKAVQRMVNAQPVRQEPAPRPFQVSENLMTAIVHKLEQLTHANEVMQKEIAALRDLPANDSEYDAVNDYEAPRGHGYDPEHYGTWINTDQHAYQVEQAILHEQEVRGRAYGG